MPRQQCYWTRSLELQLVEFVRQREFIWKPVGNTNYQIQQKYKTYAEFAALLGRGFTARSVRDRWVNIRSTFHHNLRRVDRSRKSAKSPAEVYVPSWPLWRPLQFLRHDEDNENNASHSAVNDSSVKEELPSDIELIRQRGQRTDRPRRSKAKRTKCQSIVNDLIQAMKPLDAINNEEQKCWFFGKHVTETLNNMRDDDARCARMDILQILLDYKT